MTPVSLAWEWYRYLVMRRLLSATSDVLPPVGIAWKFVLIISGTDSVIDGYYDEPVQGETAP